MFVICKECGGKHDSEKVTFVDISEGDRGQDVLTFICPITNIEASSNVYRGEFYD